MLDVTQHTTEDLLRLHGAIHTGAFVDGWYGYS